MKGFHMPRPDLAALWTTLDDIAEGAMYSLRYECETNGWRPHVWAQEPSDGCPAGLTRLIFFGTDGIGKTVYWDTVLVRDTDQIATRIKLAETLQDAKRCVQRVNAGLDRADLGLDPTPKVPAEIRALN